MHTRRIAGSAAVAALALLASACSDRLTAPAARPGSAAFTAAADGPALVSNAVRYRDTGGRPATGRAGSAALDALALLGRDGYTELELRARAANPARTATGTVAHAQAKVYDAAGTPRITRNAGGGAPLRFSGLLRGTRVDVQANVTGIDAHRTDVVSVSETVKLRPDLAVQASAGTGTVHAGTPVVVGGYITELNGDMGAQADCVLLVDGVQADQARRIWVDAGDRVSCFFTTGALAAGTHELTVRVDGVAPGDWDTANNAASVQVQAVAAPAPVHHATWVRSEQFTSREYWYNSWFDGTYRVEDSDETLRSGTSTDVQVNGGIGRGYAAPLGIELVETSGGQVLQSDAWTVPDYGSPVVCADRWNTALGTSFFFCSYFGTTSTFQFLRHSGTVTYHGLGFHREWDPATGEEYVYHWDNTFTTGTGGDTLLQGDYALTLRIASGGETTTIEASAALEPFEEHYEEPEWCAGNRDEDGWLDGFCSAGEYHASGFMGSAYFSSMP